MLYRAYDAPGPGETLVSTTYYYYNGHGKPTRVVTELENPGPVQKRFTSTLMHYACNGQAVTHVMGDAWNNNGTGIESYVRPYVREFRYDGARQRYMDAALQPFTLNYIRSGTTWTDYDGNRSYGDFVFFFNQPRDLRAFEPGVGRIDARGTSSEAVAYYHGDQIGTTRHMSDEAGAAIEPAVYTAFGEQVGGTMQDPSQRYGYAGAFGYQTHEDFPFLHVGARYYDPATGRFLQRDPIGIFGGFNVYAYVGGAVTVYIDPSGHGKKWDNFKERLRKIAEALRKAGEYIVPSPAGELAGAAACGPDAVRAAVGDAKRRHILEDHPEDPDRKNCPRCKELEEIANPDKKKDPRKGDSSHGGAAG